jgi:hypothetical protein
MRARAGAIAQGWYDTLGPFAGTYTMVAPTAAHKNAKDAWSLRYRVAPVRPRPAPFGHP